MTRAQETEPYIQVEENPEWVARVAADMFVRLAQEAKERGERFTVALSGGSTPRLLYRSLASDEYSPRVDWDNIRFFFGDERWVPPTDDSSNFKLANDELFTKAGVDPANVFPMPTEGLTPGAAEEQYEATLRTMFHMGMEEVPRFDLIFLGMGDDGHTASLFPGTEACHEGERLVVAQWVDKVDMYRLTLTPPVLQNARNVVFMVTGADKADTLYEVLYGPLNVDMYPSQLLREATGGVTWLVDKAAASKIQDSRMNIEN